MIKQEKIATVLCLIFMIACDGIAWLKYHSGPIDLYVSLSIIYMYARARGWPKPDWFGAREVAEVRSRMGREVLDHAYGPADPVHRLRNSAHVLKYFKGHIYYENTKTLCNELNEHLTYKLSFYVVGFLFLGFFGHGEELGVQIAAYVTSTLPLAYDYVKLEKQRYWNRELAD